MTYKLLKDLETTTPEMGVKLSRACVTKWQELIICCFWI